MKKLLFILVFLLSGMFVLSAQTHSGWWTGGNFGIYGYGSDDCSTCLNMELEFPSFTIMHDKTGLLAGISLFHLDSFCEDNDVIQQQNNLISGLNARLGVNLLKDIYTFDLIPYASINWAPLRGLGEYRAEAGIEFTWFTDIVVGTVFPLRVKVATFKTACGLRRDVPYFTAGVSMDFGALMHGALMSWIEDETSDNPKQKKEKDKKKCLVQF